MIQEYSQTTDKEIMSLLTVLYDTYGYDFRNYSQAHIRRRLMNSLVSLGVGSISRLKERISYDKSVASALLKELSITVTEMFRDPDFYRSLRTLVIPLLRTYPFIKIWHAGCSTGQEAYSVAILLKEEGLYDRTTIYATDFNQEALESAKAGIYSSRVMKDYTANYRASGGLESFASYYTSSYDNVIMNSGLKENIVWANHNLVTDSVFAEVHLILCRNVLIYFDKELQHHVHSLFFDSMMKGGILCLGSKESLQFSPFGAHYLILDKNQKIFKKKY